MYPSFRFKCFLTACLLHLFASIPLAAASTSQEFAPWMQAKSTPYYYNRIGLASIQAGATLPGDANGDKVVDVLDVMTVVNKVLCREVEGFITSNADLNSDNQIDVSDVMLLVYLVLHGQDMGSGSVEDPDVGGN